MKQIHEIWELLDDWILMGAIALLGRFVAHTEAVRTKKRKFWGPELLYELPTAVLTTFISYAACDYLHLSHTVTMGVVGAASYLGPRALWGWFEKRTGGPE